MLPAMLHRLVFFVLLLGGVLCTSTWANPLSLADANADTPLGAHASYLKETGAPLSLDEIVAAHAAGKFTAATSPILDFGIGSPPVWVRLGIVNPGMEPVVRRLLIENSWQDQIDIHFLAANGKTLHHQMGDTFTFASRAIRSRYFSADYRFAPGTTDIYLRVVAADPVVLPIYIDSPAAIEAREASQSYRYGFLYGYLIALMGYNFLLFIGLRDKRNLSYAMYIGMFVLMNIAYTGHGFAHVWSEHVVIQRWTIPILMVLDSTCGLVFARYFLDTPRNFPRAHKLMLWVSCLFMAALAFSMLLSEDQGAAIFIAFTYILIFSIAMPMLGVMALRAGYRFSRYFLFATLSSTISAAVTALAVMGLIEYSDLKYRAIEFGMLIDATLLALALGSQFRSIQAEKQVAEQQAATDPLTGLYNRRSFLELARPLWSNAKRYERSLSLLMVDIDHFKMINDTHGHVAGDDAILAVTQVLSAAVREGDIVARWGGEEFLVLLPETSLDSAVALAERLRKTIADIRLPMGQTEISFTVSLGVANSSGKESLDRVITEADHFLYKSKRAGRNQVSSALAATFA